MSGIVSANVPAELKRKAGTYNMKNGVPVREALYIRIAAMGRRILSEQLDGIRDTIGAKADRGAVIDAVRMSRSKG